MSKGGRMTKQVDITVRNKLVTEKRDINVYHHSDRSAHIISCNSSITRGIKPVQEEDFLQISIVSGPGHLKNDCVLDLPSFMDFRFWAAKEVTLIHSGERTLLKIPPGPPIWEIKMTIPKRFYSMDSPNGNHVIIGDAGEWPD